MRIIVRSAMSLALFVLACGVLAHGGVGAVGQDAARAVVGGGISAAGWTGKIDPGEESAGQTLNNSKLEQVGKALHAVTGPAVAYWNPANKASGNYMVKATFTEPKYMNVNDHPHPYGIVIAGN